MEICTIHLLEHPEEFCDFRPDSGQAKDIDILGSSGRRVGDSQWAQRQSYHVLKAWILEATSLDAGFSSVT